DERIRHRDDLGLVGRVGENFLVAGHGSVEADFAARGGARAEALSVKHGTVFQCQNCFHWRLTTARDARRATQRVKREAKFFKRRLLRPVPSRLFYRRRWWPLPDP